MVSVKHYLITFISFILLALGAPSVHAASLYFSPSSGTYAVGGALVVNVNVSSSDQPMNAVSGIVSFPQDKLEVASISKVGSVCNLWVQEPSFSNSYGTVNFECIVLNPGFKGSLGRVITINFTSKIQGAAVLNFSSGSILANDGNGTNILTNSGSANLILGKINVTEPVPQVFPKSDGTPSAPEISSPTHPDQSKWYQSNKAEFNWSLPQDATATRLFFDRFANTAPNISYVPPINFKEISDISDGIYYFHAQIKNDKGWGQVSHFKFQIDTQKPDYLNVNEIRRQDSTNPKARFNFNSNDSLSGIDHYQISIDNTDTQTWQDDGTHIFQTHPINPGTHTLSVEAIDRAGNFLTSSAEFIVSPLPQVFITSYPKQLEIPNTLIIKTKGSKDTKVILFLQKNDSEAMQYTEQSNEDGVATFNIDDKFKEGLYNAWVLATNDQEAKSNPSEKVKISIQQPFFLKFGGVAISFLAVLVPIIALVFLLAFLIFWMHHKISYMRRKIKKEVGEVEVALHRSFMLLKNNMVEQIRLLEKTKNKRELTEEEQRMLRKFKQDVTDAEKIVMKEIKDIEKQLK